MDLLQIFQKQWQQNFCHLSPKNCRFLLTVSGGVDSVVLVDLMDKAGFPYQIAHCNFQLRGEESERDEKFVRSLGEKYGKEILVKRFETNQYALENKISIQEAARDLRYEWFGEIIKSWKSTNDDSSHLINSFIVTAHHADDNIETMLMHFFRGTGIGGMTGIQSELKERKLIRPLLAIRKSELLAYADANRLSFVEDSSNASDKYTRNFFRNQLLPQIKEVYPQVEDNLLKNIGRFQDIAELYGQSVQAHLHKLLAYKGNEIHIPILKWKKTHPIHTITWELIKPYGFHANQTDEVIKLMDGENGAYQASSSHRIIKNRNWMIISPNKTETADHIVIEAGETKIAFEIGNLQLIPLTKEQVMISTLQSEASLDLTTLSFPLLLRKYKTGDYFYPLGMQKKKKISKFLIDLKLSKTEKEKIWVLESNKKIIWVVGYRIDNRFKITDNSKQILQITYCK